MSNLLSNLDLSIVIPIDLNRRSWDIYKRIKKSKRNNRHFSRKNTQKYRHRKNKKNNTKHKRNRRYTSYSCLEHG